MTDDFDRQAAEVLVCHGDFPSCRPDLGVHCEDCPAYYRPAVAALFRKVAEEGFNLGYATAMMADPKTQEWALDLIARYRKWKAERGEHCP